MAESEESRLELKTASALQFQDDRDANDIRDSKHGKNKNV
jgi:hypothetical protein